jgi:hypothetical protein
MATKLKIRTLPRFLSSIFAGTGTAIRKDGLATYFDLDYSLLSELTSSLDPANSLVAVYNKSSRVWNTTTLATILSAAQTTQIVTSGATVNAAAADGLIIINKTVGSATTVNVPASASKIGKLKIVDWKGDAGTNNITIVPNGTEKFNGNLSSWVIAADGGSVILDPISTGLGYGI